MIYAHLNHYIPPASDGLSEAWRRSLGRLGDYTAIVVRAMNLRPLAVALYGQTASHLLVRISLPSEHLILRVAPEDDLAAYVYFARAMVGQRLPAARIIQRDLSRTLVPFAFTLEAYVPGARADQLAEPAQLRGAGRQAGRVLRRMHRVGAGGFGRPTPAGRWQQQGWRTTLRQIGRRRAAPPSDALIFSAAEQAACARALDHVCLDLAQPVVIHGDFGPQAVRCTAGEHVHLEAIVEPGQWVGGDGLYDLACGLSPAHPAPWREGLLEGYQAAGPLSPAERQRLPTLCMLACYWDACQRYIRAEPHEAAHAEALRLLDELAGGRPISLEHQTL